MEKSVSHQAIAEELNKYLGLNLPASECDTDVGFAALAAAIMKKKLNNGDLVFLNIDLVDFEELVREHGYHEVIFGKVCVPMIESAIEPDLVAQQTPDQYSEGFWGMPDDCCARQQLFYG